MALSTKVSLLAAAVGVLAASSPLLAQSPDKYAEGDAIYAALRQSPPDARLTIGGSEIDVLFADGAPGLDRARVLAWVRTSATAVSTYFGRFPAQRVGLLVVAEDDDRIRTGTTFGYAGQAIRIHVGRRADADTFHSDWILVHEMTHLALPTVPRRSLWLQEGEATYVEPIARAQAGQLDPKEVWRWTLVGMPKGQPKPDDRGLDGTHAWGRIYWGGAAFWLQADVRIHQRTHGRLGVQTAMQAINRKSGGNTADWSVDQVMAAGDAATGGTELSDLYAQVKDAPDRVDLDTLFAQLGVGMQDGQVVFDDKAPLAWVRRQITAPRKA